MSRIIGIDLGTTNSVAAYLDEGLPVAIPNVEGERLTPSVVAFTGNGILAGGDALRQAVSNPKGTISSVKRWIGTGYRFHTDAGVHTPQEISGMILKKVKADAEAYLGERVEKAVITVPAYFNNEQREATKEAAEMASLEVIRMINEPTAASLAYGLDKEDIHTILVWDLGGGTFDVSILELGQGVFEVKAVNGDTHLGGDDWTRPIMEYLAEIARIEKGIDPMEDKEALQRLKEAAEGAKVSLSKENSAGICVSSVFGGYDLNAYLTRECFEGLTDSLLQRMVGPTLQALSDARLRPEDIDRVVLVGGATRMLAVQGLAEGIFKEKRKICRDIDPDIVVALGAAIQAGVLTGEVRDVVLVDVTPLSLGIEAEGGVFARVIGRNTPIPVSKSQIFTTAADDQTVVSIHVLQGEAGMAKENTSLGVFKLTDIPPAPKGVPRIEVTFNINANGILDVSATDLHTGNEQKIEITSISRGSSPPQ
jgi:molecular chaperone DnaK